MANVTIPNRPAGTDPRSIATILANFDAITTFLNNGGLDADNLTAALNTQLGVSSSSVIRRGKAIIPATETRTNVAYGLMPTPDRVQSLVLPTDGLIFVGYQATWQQSGGGCNAAIFLGANQLVLASGTGPSVNNAAAGISTTYSNLDTYLASSYSGLMSNNPSGGAYTGDVSTGQIVGGMNQGSSQVLQEGICTIFAAAGTYDVSVQFKAPSGSVTAKNRKLWVWTMGF